MQVFRQSFADLLRKMSFYAVGRGHKVGIYDSWSKCEEQVKGFKGAKYKKFPTRQEAEKFIETVTGISSKGCSNLTNTGKQYSPQENAVPLGKQSSKQAPQKIKTKEFWPECDGDEYTETPGDTVTEAEMLAVMQEYEASTTSTANNKNSVNSRKRKLDGYDNTSSSSNKLLKHHSKIWEPVGVETFGSYKFQVDCEGFVIAYTDGSCFNNGQKNACAGFGVYFDENHPLNAALPVKGRVTNNVGEIQAAVHAIRVALDVGIKKLCISTDSQFLINAVTSWFTTWKAKGWRLFNGKPVKNVDDFKILDKLLQDESLIVKWNYVKAHKGIHGNEMADKLAREGSDTYRTLHVVEK